MRSSAYDFLNRLKGQWHLSGKMGKTILSQMVNSDWVLNDSFIKMDFTEDPAPSLKSPYQATYYIGHDTENQKFIFHLLDNFGAKFSQTLGEGILVKDKIIFEFKYPDTIFQNIFTFIPESDSWNMLLQYKSKEGLWVKFAEKQLKRLNGFNV